MSVLDDGRGVCGYATCVVNKVSFFFSHLKRMDVAFVEVSITPGSIIFLHILPTKSPFFGITTITLLPFTFFYLLSNMSSIFLYDGYLSRLFPFNDI